MADAVVRLEEEERKETERLHRLKEDVVALERELEDGSQIERPLNGGGMVSGKSLYSIFK
jgi:hypothetical protein